ncbi:hypothetical protein ABB37_04635 [Leptomonas pyrrhocoris]|uniref:Uncharacterized protein n=1 Tax=Leptomonas pyrrhocoris TaxID=157538 RepID=A0A0M9G1L2_LEPPY|nr:hypothetical protein ABB37_04635 [Leptomonas pyrrhocoris]XP_015658822.1 hypothetical protein ABB37_04635 [Leptomonas pyrrhocoris]KPA80382.1 hypothetical protein ABB37_04635 [Leptomonas pyrrhocoris]KPA80383.1 hypothetical protein ABB37_04635 [Leptomonas pyrrhocoris]|eukprot:XP_015658821.1 hypothetical protein ABB37_04635 [Leptomonas pyrrhocoris]
MAASEGAFSRVIVEAPAAEASFYSLSYVAALQQCAALAYQPTLHSVTSSTGSSGVCGDDFTECVTRLRLETERRIAGQLRTTLLQQPSAAAVAQAKEKDDKVHPSTEAEVETVALGESTSGTTGGPSPRRGRVPSAAVGSNAASAKPSRRSSRQSSTGAAQRNSILSGTLSGTLTASSPGRRGSKELFSATLPATPVGAAMAVKLLREGLARAFGWPLPSSSLFAEAKHQSRQEGNGGITDSAQLKGLADILLSRRAFAQMPPAPGWTPTTGVLPQMPTSASAALYMELEDAEGQQDILLEWMEDVLIFALRQKFNAAQTQCLLLDSVLALQVLAETPKREGEAAAEAAAAEEENDAAWESRVSAALQDVLCTQTCPTVVRVIETVQQRQPVVREVPDPVQLAALEQKRQKATTQKALAALETAQAALPLVQQTFMEDVHTEVEKDATLPAFFSMTEAAAVVEFITRSTVMHRRLWRLVLVGASSTPVRQPLRPVMEVPLCVYVEDVPPVFLPPLSAFYSTKLQNEVDAQHSIYNDCAAEKESLFHTRYELPLAALGIEEATERQALLMAAKQAAAADRDAALTAQGCVHVEKAFALRLLDTVSHNARPCRGDAVSASASTQGRGGEGVPMANSTPAFAASAPDSSKRKKKSSNAAGAAKGSNSNSNVLGQLMLSADAAAAVPLPSGVVFTLADVEKRVDRITTAAESLPSPGASGAAGRGGQRRR